MAKALTQSQVAHLQSRMDTAIREATSALKKSLPALPAELTDMQMTAQMHNGKAKLRKNATSQSYGRLENYYVFEGDKYTELAEKHDTQITAFQDKLKAKQQAVLDSAILGDAETALAEMTKFIASLAK